jgi:hypothetical protein
MPNWWHEGAFDLLCIFNSIAVAASLVGLHSVRQQLARKIMGTGPTA